MLSLRNYCCKDFKDLAKSGINHQKCGKGRCGAFVSGHKLNVLLGVHADSPDHMDPGKSHFFAIALLGKLMLFSHRIAGYDVSLCLPLPEQVGGSRYRTPTVLFLIRAVPTI